MQEKRKVYEEMNSGRQEKEGGTMVSKGAHQKGYQVVTEGGGRVFTEEESQKKQR